jgi:hypothetical protein
MRRAACLLSLIVFAWPDISEGKEKPRLARYYPECACNETRANGTYAGDTLTLYFRNLQYEQPPGARVDVWSGSCSGLFPSCSMNNYPINGLFTAVINRWAPNSQGYYYESQVNVTIVPPGARLRRTVRP